MVTLSLCMIVKDEQDQLAACLTSVQNLVDEIVIVDTGSRDRTKEIALSFGAKVVDFVWADHFALARNESLRHATGDWILVMDADERISLLDHGKVRKLVEGGVADAYFLQQRNYTDDATLFGWIPTIGDYPESEGYKGFFLSPLVRLFRHEKSSVFLGRVHETVERSILEHGGRLGRSDVVIHHYGYQRKDRPLPQKEEHYLALGQREITEDPANPKGYFEIGKIYRHRGEFSLAIENFLKVTLLDPHFRHVYTNLGEAYAKNGNIKDALTAYKKAVELYPASEYAYINLGDIFSKARHYERAENAFKRALSINPKSIIAFHNLAAVYIQQKDFAKAKTTYKLGYRTTNHAPFLQSLRVLERREGKNS